MIMLQYFLYSNSFAAACWNDINSAIPPCCDFCTFYAIKCLRIFLFITSHHDLIYLFSGKRLEIIRNHYNLLSNCKIIYQIFIFSIRLDLIFRGKCQWSVHFCGISDQKLYIFCWYIMIQDHAVLVIAV